MQQRRRMQKTLTFLCAMRRRTYFWMTTAAAVLRAWAAARTAAFLPATVVRRNLVRTSHIRTQLCTTVALRSLQSVTEG